MDKYKKVILEAPKEEFGEQRKERSRYDEECQIATQEKNDARKKCLNKETRKNREEYEEKRKITTKLCRRKKREMWNKKIAEIKSANIRKNERKFYKEVKEMSKEYQQHYIVYKYEKGKILTEKKYVLLRLQQYFQFLLEDELQPLEETEKENENIEVLEDIDKPTYEEMIEVISNMKNGKEPGIDNITVKLIKNSGPELLQKIFELLMQIWDQERMREEREKGIFCPIFKKGDRKECSNYPGITLLNSIYSETCQVYNLHKVTTYLC